MSITGDKDTLNMYMFKAYSGTLAWTHCPVVWTFHQGCNWTISPASLCACASTCTFFLHRPWVVCSCSSTRDNSAIKSSKIYCRVLSENNNTCQIIHYIQLSDYHTLYSYANKQHNYKTLIKKTKICIFLSMRNLIWNNNEKYFSLSAVLPKNGLLYFNQPRIPFKHSRQDFISHRHRHRHHRS